jgi:hypothetical protein
LRFPTLSGVVLLDEKKKLGKVGSSVDLIIGEDFTLKREGDSRDHLSGGVYQGAHNLGFTVHG